MGYLREFDHPNRPVTMQEFERCQRCDRVLKDPKTRAEGMGKVCKKKAAAEAAAADKSVLS